MGANWGIGARRTLGAARLMTVGAFALVAVALTSAGCTVNPPVTGPANLPNGTGSITIEQGPVGATGLCLPSIFGLSYVAQDTPTEFVLTITASPSMCETINPVAAIYAMPKGATDLGNAFPQKLATRTPFTISGPGVTTVTFHKGCLPAQFDVVTGDTPPVIWPGGPYHGPMLFPFPWGAGSAGLWYGSDCGGGTGCENYTPTNLAVTPTSVAPGGTITVSGSGTPGTTITIAFRQPPAAAVPTGVTVPVPANGQWSTPVTVPASLTPGTWQVVAGVEGCEVEVTADITVTSTQPTVPPTTPPTNPSVPPSSSVPSEVGGATTVAPTTQGPTGSQPLPTAAVQGTTQTNSSNSAASGLAFTGSSVRLPILIGIALLVLGTLLVLQRRRRHS